MTDRRLVLLKEGLKKEKQEHHRHESYQEKDRTRVCFVIQLEA
jgi:hypothetical protein